MEMLRIHRDDDRAWTYMPQVLRRLMAFCTDFDTDMQPQEVANFVMAWFIMGDRRLGLWILIHEGKVFGHLWATPEPIGSDYWTYLLIRQAKADTGLDARVLTRQVFDETKAWGVSLGLGKLMMLTHRNAIAMARRWGFKTKRVMMEQSLPKKEG